MTPAVSQHEIDSAIRTAKLFGCRCRPEVRWTKMHDHYIEVTLRHSRACPYDPAAVFEPTEEFDEEANAKRAKLLKARKSKMVRQANRRKQ